MKRTEGDGFVFISLSDEARRLVAENAAGFVEAGAIMARDEVVQTMEASSPSGRTYQVPGTATNYTASAPGQPPAIREGNYKRSWKNTPPSEVGKEVVAYAYTDLRVGRWVLGDLLEYGTKRMRPRPHVRKSVETVAPKLKRFIEDASK